jgi:anti-sigma B factor antagonist
MSPPRPFKVEVREGPSRRTVAIEGEMDIASLEALAVARERALVGEPAVVRIDLVAVDFIDSSGLRFLLETYRLALAREVELQIVAPSTAAMQVLTLTGADKRLPFVTDTSP